MDADRWRRIGELFDQVVEAPVHEREALLRRLCGDDEVLLREIRALLAADAAGGALDQRTPQLRDAVAIDWVRDQESAAPIGNVIGSWRVLRELGRGGMGVVLLVERAVGQFEQRAALKLIKRGMDSEAVLARFLRERQILARLSHPGIARLIDGGLSADHRPYFVMEYVEGMSLLEYCMQRESGLRGRIECILQVCAALQFAHRQLVVHLDIKPTNVLVTDSGEIKLLDFGIAKLLGSDRSDIAAQTGTGGDRPLTPGYASPEQLQGEPVTTATDIYGVGSLLYELLTGRRANGLADSASLEQARAALARGEPMAPSDAVVEIANATAPVSARQLRGDLDTIVLKALKHEPERRYATVESLAEDLQRHLSGQPIAARRESALYRTGKFVRRHRVGVMLAVVALVALLATTAVALREAKSARDQAQRAQAVTDFLVDTFRVADPRGAPGGVKLTAKEVLDAGAQRMETELVKQPQLAASFSEVLGKIYLELGEFDRSIALLQRSLQLRQDQDHKSPAYADTIALLARSQYEKGDYAAATQSAQRALADDRTRGKAESPSVARDLALQGEIARRQGDFNKSELLLQQALAMSRATLKTPAAQIAAQLNQLAALYGDMRKLDIAATLTEQALAMFRGLYGEKHLDVAENLVNLGVFRMQTERIEEALPLFAEAIAIYRTLLPADHPLLALALANQARAFDRLKHYRQADPIYREALAMQRRILGNQHPDLATTLNNLAVLRLHMDDFAGSADYSRQAMAIWAAQGRPEHPFALISKAHLGVALRESGDLVESERVTREVLNARRRQLGAENLPVSLSLDDLGVVLRLSGHAAEAVAMQKQAQAIRDKGVAMPALESAAARTQYALSESAAGDQSDATHEVHAALAALLAMKTPSREQIATTLIAKARIAFAQGDIEAGCAAARQALDLRPPDDMLTGWRHAEAQSVHGECLRQRKQFAAARQELQSALATLQRVRGVDHWMTRQTQALLQSLPGI